MISNKIYIYGLVCPIDKSIRYIGKSIRPKERLQNHMNEVSNCHRSHWLQSLKKIGLKPSIQILQVINSDSLITWQEAEKNWIKFGRRIGLNLTNNTDGGDGVVNLPKETREKMRKTWLGRKHKPETLIKLSKASKGRKKSDQAKKYMKELMMGRLNNWGHKVAQSMRKFSKSDVDAIKKRLDNGELGINLAKEYKVHRTTISKIKMGKYFVVMPD